MDRRDFLATGTLGLCSVTGCAGPWLGGNDSDQWQIGEFAVRTSISDGETVTVNIRDDDTVVYDQELRLPAVEEGRYREISTSGYPTDPGLYTVTCLFAGDTEEYRATFTPARPADNQDCYNLYPHATETGNQRSALMGANICHEETPTGE